MAKPDTSLSDTPNRDDVRIMLMKQQWDEIARENPFYGVLSLNEYEVASAVDVEKFWESGRKDVDNFLALLDLGDTRDLSMLEIGCGLGRMTHHFEQRFRKVYALDVSPTMLERARGYWGKSQSIEWILGNGEDLHQLGDSSVELVFSFMTLQHVPEASSVLQYISEASRVLTEGGTAFLQFRVRPGGMSLSAVKHYLATQAPPLLIKPIRKVWDVLNGHNRTRARWASDYESWRGCALTPGAIEAAAMAARLHVRSAGDLGKSYRYYIFQKNTQRRT
jgi:ubiquinone/menaquinone biosynthesis C-methylase UbiE